jgi:hypothetical protein
MKVRYFALQDLKGESEEHAFKVLLDVLLDFLAFGSLVHYCYVGLFQSIHFHEPWL